MSNNRNSSAKKLLNKLKGNKQKTKDDFLQKKMIFSFRLFNRTHPLFNLGDEKEKDNIIKSEWFIHLLDCLKEVSDKTPTELKNPTHDLHPIDCWEKTNLKKIPDISLNIGIQHEWYQFRISKSKGRVIGMKIDNVFYIVYLDPFHNLTNSEGYGKQKKQPPPNI